MALSFLADNNDPDVINCTTYTKVIRNRSKSYPDRLLFSFLSDGVTENESFTFGQLDQRSKAVAAGLQENGKKGDTVLLLFQPGLAYVASLYACLYSGFIAIPAYPPRRNRGIDRIHTIIRDSGTKICLISRQVYDDILRNFKDDELFSSLEWIVYDDIQNESAHSFLETELHKSDIALIQYTSGSTGQPKGVMISQENLLYNSEYIRRTFNTSEKSIGVHWLPLFHDMGLIGGLLHAAYIRGHNINIPPMEFLKNPLNFLKAIDRFKANIAGGPNFSLDYCVEKTTPEERKELDLSSMEVYFCGAEPIRESTYKNFTEAFKVSKIKEEHLYSCYGMAETTLIVTGGLWSDKPVYLNVNGTSLSENKVVISPESEVNGVTLVGSGRTWMDTIVKIVDPLTFMECRKDEVGEIWISGPTVAAGYWKKEDETERTFNAHISDTNEGPFLRTGDMGFFHNKELFITGRIKDLIIIRGVNYYPNDIEFSIQKSIPEIRQNGGAAFPVTIGNEEKLVVVQEIERTAMRSDNHQEIISRIREVISLEYELDAHAIVLIRPGSIPLTSSGKIQHRQTKFEYLHNDLNIVAIWENIHLVSKSQTDNLSAVPTEDSIKEWVISWIERNQNVARENIDPENNLMSYGIDSLAAVTLETEISQHFGFQWHISSFILNPTINGLAKEGMLLFNESRNQ